MMHTPAHKYLPNFEMPLKKEVETMKLYELSRDSYFQLDNGVLLDNDNREVYYFDHIDGMYSLCYDKNGNPVHFAAWTPVKYYQND